MKKLWFAGAVALLSWSGWGTSVAEGQDGDPGTETRARAHYERGRAAFHAGDYEAAIEAYRASWELSRRPELLYNLGTVYDRLRRDEEALEMFEQFLDLQSDSEVVEEVRARVRVLRSRLDDPSAPQEEPGHEMPELEPATDPPAPTVRGGPSFVWTFVLGGAAIVSAGVAIPVGLLANDSYAELTDGCGAAGGCTEAQIDASGVETESLVTNVLWATAGAFALAAVIAVIVEASSSSEPNVEVALGPSALQLRGMF